MRVSKVYQQRVPKFPLGINKVSIYLSIYLSNKVYLFLIHITGSREGRLYVFLIHITGSREDRSREEV